MAFNFSRARKEFERTKRPGAHGPVVYFMQFGDGEPIKIGFTTDIGVRLEVIRSAHWQEMTILSAMKGDRSTEKALHKKFAKHRVSGEWFRPAEEILRMARTHNAKKENQDDPDLTDALMKSIELAKGADLDTVFKGTRSQP